MGSRVRRARVCDFHVAERMEARQGGEWGWGPLSVVSGPSSVVRRMLLVLGYLLFVGGSTEVGCDALPGETSMPTRTWALPGEEGGALRGSGLWEFGVAGGDGGQSSL